MDLFEIGICMDAEMIFPDFLAENLNSSLSQRHYTFISNDTVVTQVLESLIH